MLFDRHDRGSYGTMPIVDYVSTLSSSLKSFICASHVEITALCTKLIFPDLSEKDVIAQAQSGTGKTATFSVAVLQNIDETIPEVQALIMAPTRELALQVSEIRLLAVFCLVILGLKYHCFLYHLYP